MDGFPNFFLIFSPNTVTGHFSVTLASENMVNYALKFIKPISQGEVKTCEVKENAERRWTERLQRELKNSVWMSGGCTSWYRKGDWNATAYP
jgi:cation diffusion facilitator CzcD-associated flavoprotein CzcO